MTTKQLISIEEGLLVNLPDFAIKDQLMFIHPVEGLLRGIYFDRATTDKDVFYINLCVMPLCVPTKHLYFNFGKRLRYVGSERWSTELPGLQEKIMEALKDGGLRFLHDIKSFLDFINLAKTFSAKNPHTLQAIAYSLLRIGKFEETIKLLATLIQQLDVKIPWQKEILERAVFLKSSLEKDPVDAQKTLEVWESQVIRDFGLG